VQNADPILVMGVDPGKTTGWVVIKVYRKNNKWELLERGEVASVEDGAGLHMLDVMLRAKITTNRAEDIPVAAVAMEQLMAYTNTAQEKAEAQGIVRLSAYMAMVTLYTYAPTTIRAVVVGSGKAKASDVAQVTRRLADLGRTKRGESFTPHQQDALAAALCCCLKEDFLRTLESTDAMPVHTAKQPVKE
jgi:Holliday junction resolvasome RuvABC endonuclease subunit